MLIRVEGGKGGKDRYTLLSKMLLSDFGHSSSKTTEIYTHVAVNSFKSIKNPLDCHEECL